ncbi:MAG: cysteine hydrolase [Anaerotruncus sp.]|nr:cysteine hydrolase [Anaerotruncus sp.]
MGKRYLIVVDMQNDFITGSLGSAAAQTIVLQVAEKIRHFKGEVLFTRDTHRQNYLQTQEGRNLPIEHCIKDSEGWQICKELAQVCDVETARVFDKGCFGSVELAQTLAEEHQKQPLESVELIGLCTDICVISNAMLLKAFLPEVPISVDASCCAGVTLQSHQTALDAMRACQIEIC